MKMLEKGRGDFFVFFIVCVLGVCLLEDGVSNFYVLKLNATTLHKFSPILPFPCMYD